MFDDKWVGFISHWNYEEIDDASIHMLFLLFVGMYLCYKPYTSSNRVVSIRSEQEKHVYLQPRDLHSHIDLVPLHQIN